jgi:hypothetical protein
MNLSDLHKLSIDETSLVTEDSLTLTMTKLTCHPEGAQQSKGLLKAKSIDLYVAMNLSDLHKLSIDKTL